METDELKKLEATIDEFHQESDRGCAVLMMCVLEDCLLEAIARRLPDANKDMLRNIAPPGRLSSTLNNAYLLGLVSSKERDEFEILIKVRNKFAHAALSKLAFAHHDVKHLCKKLTLCDTFSEYTSDEPRARFLLTSVLMIFMLRATGAGESDKLKIKEDTEYNLIG